MSVVSIIVLKTRNPTVKKMRHCTFPHWVDILVGRHSFIRSHNYLCKFYERRHYWVLIGTQECACEVRSESQGERTSCCKVYTWECTSLWKHERVLMTFGGGLKVLSWNWTGVQYLDGPLFPWLSTISWSHQKMHTVLNWVVIVSIFI